MRNPSRLLAATMLAAILWLSWAAPGQAGTRIALVIGNAAYQNVPPLANPANDAGDLAKALRGIGFEVIEARDATRASMAEAVRDFAERLRGADVALLFYSGHGMQMNGENYLLPVDAKIQTPADVRFNTINLTDIQQEMDGNGRVNIIILDACRTNPFADKIAHAGRAVLTRGLGRVDAAGEGSLIVFATQPNNVAYDGDGRNSPFTGALIKHIATPGLEVRQMLSRVRGDVLAATEKRQTPWDSSSLVGDVFLAGGPAEASAPATPAPSPAGSAEVSPATTAPAPSQVAAVATEGAATEASKKTTLPNAAASITPVPGATSGAVTADSGSVTAAGIASPSAATPPAEPTNDCERAAPIAPYFATPQQLKRSKHIDWANAVAVCQRVAAADPGNTKLQNLLGVALEGAKNYIDAARHYRFAAEAGNPSAMNSLGVLYATGKGLIRNDETAYKWISKASELGDAAALGNLGVMYERGAFVHVDYAKALELYERAIEGGSSFALNQAAVLFLTGQGVEKDYNVAAQYFQQAADLDDGYALKYLAILYERGMLGPKDPEKAGELRQKAAQVDPDSQDPVVPASLGAPQISAPARHATTYRRYYVRRYRFFGCSWVWC